MESLVLASDTFRQRVVDEPVQVELGALFHLRNFGFFEPSGLSRFDQHKLLQVVKLGFEIVFAGVVANKLDLLLSFLCRQSSLSVFEQVLKSQLPLLVLALFDLRVDGLLDDPVLVKGRLWGTRSRQCSRSSFQFALRKRLRGDSGVRRDGARTSRHKCLRVHIDRNRDWWLGRCCRR